MTFFLFPITDGSSKYFPVPKHLETLRKLEIWVLMDWGGGGYVYCRRLLSRCSLLQGQKLFQKMTKWFGALEFTLNSHAKEKTIINK